jgi:hypothetical protein
MAASMAASFGSPRFSPSSRLATMVRSSHASGSVDQRDGALRSSSAALPGVPAGACELQRPTLRAVNSESSAVASTWRQALLRQSAATITFASASPSAKHAFRLLNLRRVWPVAATRRTLKPSGASLRNEVSRSLLFIEQLELRR